MTLDELHSRRLLLEQGLVGRFRLPNGSEPRGGLLVLGGAEGGIERADELAEQFVTVGFATLALAYFGMSSLPAMLEEIPLEYFHKAIDWMRETAGIDAARLGVVGGSKGAEAALLIGATYQVQAVVAYLPSHVAWQALNWQPPPRSSWRHRGVSVPFVRYVNAAERMRREGLRGLYAASLEADPHAVHAAEIPVERTQGAVLVISGGQDGVWPSTEMARKVVDRLRASGFAYSYQHLEYPDAGHAIMGLAPAPTSVQAPWGELHFGGTEAANASARADAWSNVLRFLHATLK